MNDLEEDLIGESIRLLIRTAENHDAGDNQRVCAIAGLLDAGVGDTWLTNLPSLLHAAQSDASVNAAGALVWYGGAEDRARGLAAAFSMAETGSAHPMGAACVRLLLAEGGLEYQERTIALAAAHNALEINVADVMLRSANPRARNLACAALLARQLDPAQPLGDRVQAAALLAHHASAWVSERCSGFLMEVASDLRAAPIDRYSAIFELAGAGVIAPRPLVELATEVALRCGDDSITALSCLDIVADLDVSRLPVHWLVAMACDGTEDPHRRIDAAQLVLSHGDADAEVIVRNMLWTLVHGRGVAPYQRIRAAECLGSLDRFAPTPIVDIMLGMASNRSVSDHDRFFAAKAAMAMADRQQRAVAVRELAELAAPPDAVTALWVAGLFGGRPLLPPAFWLRLA